MELEGLLTTFVEKPGIYLLPQQPLEREKFIRNSIAPFGIEMAESAALDTEPAGENKDTLIARFLYSFEAESREKSLELLDLGQASYQYQDDDNIYLSRIEKPMKVAMDIGKDRIAQRRDTNRTTTGSAVLIKTLEKPAREFSQSSATVDKGTNPSVRARQIFGQPAGPGIARGKERVIFRQSDLFAFKKGEIRVCDALDPNMTFVIPLSAGIVERQGGMLIHGAIMRGCTDFPA